MPFNSEDLCKESYTILIQRYFEGSYE